MSDHETDELLEQVALGSRQAVDSLLAKHRDRLVRLIQIRRDPRLNARVDPSDVVQDVLVEAAARLPIYAQERPIPFYCWLRRLAWDHLIALHEKHIAAQKRSVKREHNLVATDNSIGALAIRLSTASPSQIAIRREMKQRVHDALNQLNDRDRDFLIMKHLEEMTLPEIAATLDISISAAKGRHLRALNRLSTQLGASRNR